ncbi:hypothetical protein [Cellulosilyticum ruminicola]|uniref:hypothetical protein n=1 Tax=Cellulosilyticum ruminicola TaxID=425254 RepID=UPI0006D105A4|nr:hypothetical protein [Cellulosilyticum ruminicola]
MHTFLNIQEVPLELDEHAFKKSQIRITNTSSQFINNLTLNINASDFPFIEQTIIRKRGSLSYDKIQLTLELGNLAPNETALFEYKYPDTFTSYTLLTHLEFSYTPDNADAQIIETCNISNPPNWCETEKGIDK